MEAFSAAARRPSRNGLGEAVSAETATAMGSDRDVTFCAVERVAGQVFVCVATTALQGWSIYRVNKFGAAPVQARVFCAYRCSYTRERGNGVLMASLCVLLDA